VSDKLVKKFIGRRFLYPAANIHAIF